MRTKTLRLTYTVIRGSLGCKETWACKLGNEAHVLIVIEQLEEHLQVGEVQSEFHFGS